MAKPDFARLPNSGRTYPIKNYDGQENQSYNFLDARKVQTGNTRGTQTVGYGGAKIDGANNRIIITNPSDNTSIGLGEIPGTTNFGFFSLDSSGNIIYKNVSGTQTYYNPVDNLNPAIIIGGAPDDGRTGIWVAKVGQNVIELLGG